MSLFDRLMRLMSAGVYGRINRKYAPTRDQCNQGDQNLRDSQQPLGMDIMCGIFYLLGGGMLLASISLVMEVITSRRHRSCRIKITRDAQYDINRLDKPTEELELGTLKLSSMMN
jgi:hypothetical protein